MLPQGCRCHGFGVGVTAHSNCASDARRRCRFPRMTVQETFPSSPVDTTVCAGEPLKTTQKQGQSTANWFHCGTPTRWTQTISPKLVEAPNKSLLTSCQGQSRTELPRPGRRGLQPEPTLGVPEMARPPLPLGVPGPTLGIVPDPSQERGVAMEIGEHTTTQTMDTSRYITLAGTPWWKGDQDPGRSLNCLILTNPGLHQAAHSEV